MSTVFFQLLTLVDITPTGVIRSSVPHDQSRNQQRNFETVLQILSLRTQPHISKMPEVDIFSTAEIWFGDMYSHQPQKIWRFFFTADFPDAYANSTSPVGNLLSDFNEVPIITGLTESARFILPIFYSYGSIKNIHLMAFSKK
jgi:hypothetical protein